MARPTRPGRTSSSRGAPATSYDVARLAGVSQSAVSRCFNPGASISDRTRAKIIKAANTLGYRPNAIARGLITRRSNMVAVIIGNLTNMVSPEMLFHLNQRLAQRHVHLLLFTVSNERNVAEILEEVWQYRVDGVVVAAQFTPEQIDACRARNLPIVLYDRTSDKPGVTAVCCDHEPGQRELVDRLVRAGHRHFVVLGGPVDAECGTVRTRGAIDAIQRVGGLTCQLIEGDDTYRCGRERAGQIVAMRRRPDAVVCTSDDLAMGCMDGLRHDHGLSIPADISVTGFGGASVGEWLSYDLTTVLQPVASMVETAVDMLLERIENPGLPAEARLFAGALRVGGSARLHGGARRT